MAFLPDFEVVEAPVRPARATALFIHGIMGSARNWRSFAQRFVQAMPDHRAVLVNLRHHGKSRGAPPPDDLAACARDLDRLHAQCGPFAVLIAHSFGGKVAIEWMKSAPAGLERVIVLDCPLGAVPAGFAPQTEVARVMAAIRRLPEPMTRRSLAQETLLEDGFPAALAGWMATNLEKGEGGYRWTFDPEGVSRLLEDYWRRDLRAAAAAPPAGIQVDLVRALASDRWTPDELAWMGALPADGPTRAHDFPDAGHWLHVDDPGGLVRFLKERVES